MSEMIWLISVSADEYDDAMPLTARRTIESAQQYCDENRKLHDGKGFELVPHAKRPDYSTGPVHWGAVKNNQVLGKAVVNYMYKGKQEETQLFYILEEITLED